VSGHTPGEWSLYADRIAAPCYEHAGCEKTIAWRDHHGLGDPESGSGALRCTVGPCEAENARLIAAAPDMRKALDSFRWLGNNLHNITDSPVVFREFYVAALEDANAAIAKAEGR
jgi:hypothetical protein